MRPPRSFHFLPPALLLCWLLLASAAGAQTTLHYRFNDLPLSIPDGNPSGVLDSRSIASGLGGAVVLKVRVYLEIGGASPLNGDLYVVLQHQNHSAVLLNRVGRRADDLAGYGDGGFNIALDDESAGGNVHEYRLALFGGEEESLLGEPLSGEWASDGRNLDPSMVLNDSERTASLSSFNGLEVDGTWRLFLADMASGGQSRLISWGLDITATTAPSPPLSFTEATLRSQGSARLLENALALTGQNVFEANSRFTASGPVLGEGSLTKTGPGALALLAGNDYSGGTVIKSGILLCDNPAGSAAGSGPVRVEAQGILGGFGGVAGAVTLDGTLSPGEGVGKFFSGSQVWNAGGHCRWEIGSSAGIRGVDWDLAAVSGSLTINATAQNKFIFDIASLALTGFDAAQNHAWTILTSTDGVAGFDPGAFELRSADFAPPLGAGNFSLALANGGKDLQLLFVASSAPPNRPPVAANDAAGTTLNKPITIAAGKLAANDFDADGDPLSVLAVDAVSALGGSVSLAASQILYTPPLNVTGADSFGYTISDGRGGTAQAAVIVQIRAVSGAQPLGITIAGDLSKTVKFIGLPGRAYLVQTAGDAGAGPWMTRIAVTAGRTGRFEYLDTEIVSQCFYRAIAP